MDITNASLYVFSFFAIWLGAGLIISSVDRIAKQLKLSSFAISFFVLGLLTSIPETAVSFNAVSEGNPEIFVGTLLGGVAVIFLLVLPILAIFGRGLAITSHLSRRNLLLALIVMAIPSFLVIDRRVTNLEGIIMIASYLILFYFIQKKHGIFDSNEKAVFSLKAYSFLDLVKVIFGIGLVFVTGDFIVQQTIAYSEFFNIPTFYISLIILALGTNLPELSLAIRSIISGKKEIAFGDYLGSAAANTLLFGLFTLISEGEVITVNNFFVTFLFIALGLGLFYFFARSERNITPKEGAILFSVYLLFVLYELGGEFLT